MPRLFFAILALLAVVVLTPGSAQSQRAGRISGVVRDGQLRPLPSVEVTLVTRQRNYVVFTNERGEFAFDSLPDGRAVVVARLSGYAATRRYEVDVRGGTSHDVEVVLYLRLSMPIEEFDPYYNRPVDFAEPRGFSAGLFVNRSTSTLAIGTAEADGSANAVRAEVALEFDKHWMFAIRGGWLFGTTSSDVNFPFNATNTFTYRDYRTQRLDAAVRYLVTENVRRFRPFVTGAFGLSWFSGDVRATNVDNPVRTRGSGLTVALGGGVQIEATRKLAFDIGVEMSGASFEEWRFNDAVIGLPNLRVYGTDFIIAARWWPTAR